jgi:hypothetical protein
VTADTFSFKMDNEIIVRLKILSVIRTPEQITKLLGVSPDKSWHIGDRRSKTIIVEKSHGWVIHSGLPKTASLEAHIQALFSLLSPHVGSIKELSVEDTVEFSIVIYALTPPALYFEKGVIETIALYGASFDIDLYLIEASSPSDDNR